MAGVKKTPPNLILANAIQSWSNQYGIKDDPYLSQLHQAVNTRKNLPMWASLDPLEYLPHAKVESNKQFHLVALVMAIVRNALVFLPVALTWFAISKATNAFATYTANNTLSVVNFLDFWENGYGVLSCTRIAEIPEGSRYLIKHSVTKIDVLIEEINQALLFSAS
jgi:hypothetical protein